MTVKVLLVEDKLSIADYMQVCLQNLGYLVCEICIRYDGVIATFEKHKPDIALIDISLKETKFGIDLVNHIKHYCPIPFVLATSYSDKATKATLPYAYLIKPFIANDLYFLIETALMNFCRIQHKNKFITIPLAATYYVQANYNYATLYSNRVNYFVKATLKNLLNNLHEFFGRIHHSYAIILKSLKKFIANEVLVPNTKLPLAKIFMLYLTRI